MRIHNISHRFDSLLKLEYEQRVNFVTEYGVPTSHILAEHFRTFPVTYGFQKNSIFTSKFSEVIRFVLNYTEYYDVLTLSSTCRILNEAGLIVYWKNNEMDKVSHLKINVRFCILTKSFLISRQASLKPQGSVHKRPHLTNCLTCLVIFWFCSVASSLDFSA